MWKSPSLCPFEEYIMLDILFTTLQCLWIKHDNNGTFGEDYFEIRCGRIKACSFYVKVWMEIFENLM